MTDETIIPAADESEQLQQAKAIEAARMRNAFLAGATEGITFGNSHDLRLAVVSIMACDAHGGRHHFAVTGEGTMLWASQTAMECINAAGLGFTIPGYATPEKVEPTPGYHDPSSATPRERCPKCGGVEIAPYKYDHSSDCPSN